MKRHGLVLFAEELPSDQWVSSEEADPVEQWSDGKVSILPWTINGENSQLAGWFFLGKIPI
jgi:hypothetical protein